MTIKHLLLSFSFFLLPLFSKAQVPVDSAQTGLPEEVQKHAEITLKELSVAVEDGQLVFRSPGANGMAKVIVNKDTTEVTFGQGVSPFDFSVDERGRLALLKSEGSGYRLYHISKLQESRYRIRSIPFWLSVLPPVIAIALALIFKEVVVSLFAGVWAGAFIAGGLRIESIYYFLDSILRVVQKYMIDALTGSGHLAVIVFSLLIGGMVAIISKNGGMAGVVLSLSKYAKSPRSSQLVTWFLGVAIFFDDYANTLIVGNTMRSVTDAFKVSREKLAYIVDSTAAPVAAVAFITTWIGAELGYIDTGLHLIQHFDSSASAYSIFLSSLKYSFYPVLTLFFMLVLIYTKRDYGPMFKAEKRARTTGQVAPIKDSNVKVESDDLDPVEGASLKWQFAFFPVLVVILMTIYGLVDTGMTSLYGKLMAAGVDVSAPTWSQVWSHIGALKDVESSFFMKIGKLIGEADSFVALLWASFSGISLAIVMTLWAGIMKINQTITTMVTGFRAILPAIIILTLAWSLASSTEELYTATYLSAALKGAISPHMLPVIVFMLAAFISFSTGSSWSTMAILYPIAIPTSWVICHSAGLDDFNSMEIMLNVIAVVLGASVLGDHCSPISDTTILSSLASDCNHIDHVKTQLPYAMTVGGVSVLLCWLSTWFEGGWGLSILLLLLGMVILVGVVLKFGKKIPSVAES
ncbi:MAG: Na+/H+ antiporter NhaC family protein [Saprospiraceae bacterium]